MDFTLQLHMCFIFSHDILVILYDYTSDFVSSPFSVIDTQSQ